MFEPSQSSGVEWSVMCSFRDDWVVRVRAQVMTRDESTGGWVPLGRGGMSVVGLRRLTTASDKDIMTEYRLHGQRIADQSVGDANDSIRFRQMYIVPNPHLQVLIDSTCKCWFFCLLLASTCTCSR